MIPQEDTIPYGYCHCGCGGNTTIPKQTDRKAGRVIGVPMRYLRGHHPRVRVPLMERYRVEPNGCWIWLGSAAGRGYGWIRVGRKMRRAHVVLWEARHGPVPDGMELDHLCRRTTCCNPDHLEPVPHVVNVQRGDVAKLTPEQVASIRAVGSSRRQIDVARDYGVSQTLVSKILRGEIWKNVGVQ